MASLSYKYPSGLQQIPEMFASSSQTIEALFARAHLKHKRGTSEKSTYVTTAFLHGCKVRQQQSNSCKTRTFHVNDLPFKNHQSSLRWTVRHKLVSLRRHTHTHTHTQTDRHFCLLVNRVSKFSQPQEQNKTNPRSENWLKQQTNPDGVFSESDILATVSGLLCVFPSLIVGIHCSCCTILCVSGHRELLLSATFRYFLVYCFSVQKYVFSG